MNLQPQPFGTCAPECESPIVMEMPAELAAAVVAETADLPIYVLSSRERDVVKLVLESATNAEIAERLGVNLRTVQDRLRRAFQKLGVRNGINLNAVSTSAVNAAAETRNKEKAYEFNFDFLDRTHLQTRERVQQDLERLQELRRQTAP